MHVLFYVVEVFLILSNLFKLLRLLQVLELLLLIVILDELPLLLFFHLLPAYDVQAILPLLDLIDFLGQHLTQLLLLLPVVELTELLLNIFLPHLLKFHFFLIVFDVLVDQDIIGAEKAAVVGESTVVGKLRLPVLQGFSARVVVELERFVFLGADHGG